MINQKDTHVGLVLLRLMGTRKISYVKKIPYLCFLLSYLFMGIGSPTVLKSLQLGSPSALSWTGTQQQRKNLGYGMPPLYRDIQILPIVGISKN